MVAPTFANSPSYSCRIWHDRGAIYVELASGLITKFDKTEGALSKVLKLLDRESRNQPTNGRSRATFPMEPKRVKPEVSAESKSKALEILRRKGIL
jgi:hypothetical protein